MTTADNGIHLRTENSCAVQWAVTGISDSGKERQNCLVQVSCLTKSVGVFSDFNMSLTSGNESNVSNSSVEHSPDSSFGSGSGSSSRFAHLWGYEGRQIGKTSTILEGGDGNGTSGEDESNTSGAGASLNLNETGAATEFNESGIIEDEDGATNGAAAACCNTSPLPTMPVGLEGFGRLSVGESLNTTASYTQQMYPFSSASETSSYHTPNFNIDAFGQLLNGVDQMSPYRYTGRKPYGFDAPPMTPPALSMPSRDFEDRTPLSPESTRGNDFMRSLAALEPPRSHTGLTIRQTIEQLKMLQELQDFSNSSGGDPFQRRQISALITTLQQHLMTQFTPNNDPASPTSPPSYNRTRTDGYLERAALYHREMAQVSSANLKWTGILPQKRNYRDQIYSTKVFLGGLPWEVTENCLINTFKPFGRVRVEWPGKDGNRPKGYAYVLFDTERQVKHLLQNCTHDYTKGADYIRLCSRYINKKDIQVIPWAVGDSNFVRCPDTKLDPQKTIFVGALHGMLNAEGLSHIMQELFGGVVYAGIDTDRNKYPIGSGRVTFDNNMSYLKAVTAAFIEIRTNEFTKKIQVDPYLEDANCSVCKVQQGPYFCRDAACFSYFCSSCFQSVHMDTQYRAHRPLMRNANKIGTPTSIMPTNFRARSSLTEISHSGNMQNRFGFGPSFDQPRWERFYE